MPAEGVDLATNVVKELSLIKERVAYLEEENALLKRIDRHVALATTEATHLPYAASTPLRSSRLRNADRYTRYKHAHAAKHIDGGRPTTALAAAFDNSLPATHLLADYAATKRASSFTKAAPQLPCQQRRLHHDGTLQPVTLPSTARALPNGTRLRVASVPAALSGVSTAHIYAHQRRPSGRNIWVGSDHRSLQVSHELLGAALPDAVRGFPVAIFAKYEDNVNTAVKGVAIAAERLRDQGRHVCVEASFRENRNEVTLLVVDMPLRHLDKSHGLLDDAVTKVALQQQQPDDSFFYGSGIHKRIHDRGALTVSSQTDYKILGGAIASRVRYSKPTVLRAIGKRAVWAATRAIAVAREYVVETGPNLVFTPRFNSVQLSNRTEPSTVVELCVCAFD